MILNIIIRIYSFSNEGHSCEHLGAIEIETIHDRISKDRRVKKRWTYKERFIVGKYTSQTGTAAAVDIISRNTQVSLEAQYEDSNFVLKKSLRLQQKDN